MENYTPNHSSDGIDPHVKAGLFWYCMATIVFGGLAAYLLVNYPSLTPNDPELMLRAITEKVIKIIIILIFAVGTVMYCDWRWNGNLYKGIINDKLAPAIFGSTLFLGVILLGCYL